MQYRSAAQWSFDGCEIQLFMSTKVDSFKNMSTKHPSIKFEIREGKSYIVIHICTYGGTVSVWEFSILVRYIFCEKGHFTKETNLHIFR